MGKRFNRFFAGLTAGYLRLIGVTGKVAFEGHAELLDGEETFAVGFWHGDSLCYYPQFRDRGHVIVTTVNGRGDVVEMVGRMFGYTPVRLPDEHDPDASLLGLRRMLAEAVGRHACYSMDGPLGPYHVPSRFFLTAAYLTKKRVLPVSVRMKRRICLKRRWDNYMIPLPFCRLTFTFHDPIAVKKNGFEAAAEAIVRAMDGEPRG
ncbi:MAG: hypothetical protein LBH95_08195 [Oscillospiraceae bacterium]|jgi:lysophospholipid acyltransferase (LPLAT)-like uncharacterized protein|nr:hypothetical protein [Oscillospiraceae bacterium]